MNEQKRILVKCSSHRCNRRVRGIISDKRQFCSFTRSVGYGVFAVTAEEKAYLTGKSRDKKIPGLSGYKDGPDLFYCWSMK